jgi:AcrR family transcriptional regulator
MAPMQGGMMGRLETRSAELQVARSGFLETEVKSELTPKRLRILQRAADAFVTRGYEGTTLDEIAMQAAVSKVTLYQLFGSKAQLFHATVIASVSRMAEPLEALLNSDGPMQEVLTHYATAYALRMIAPIAGRHPFFEMARVMIGNIRDHPSLAGACWLIFQRGHVMPLEGYFARKIADGLVGEEDPTFLASHFTQMLFFTNFVAFELTNAPAPAEIGNLARRKVNLFLRGCEVMQPPAQDAQGVAPAG